MMVIARRRNVPGAYRARACMIALGCVLPSAAALAQPAALDRVPAGAPFIIVVPSIEKLEAGFEQVQKTFGMAPDEGPLAEFKLHEIINLEGLNKQGSLAMAVLAGEDGQVDFEADDPPMVLIVPVSDYAKFAEAGGADPAAPLGEWDAFDEGSPAFIKKLDGGFAALGVDEEMVRGFRGAPGNGAAHMKLVGANGRPVLESSIVSAVADLQALAPQIRDGFQGFRQQIEQMAEMTGQDMGANLAMVDALGEALARDGQAGLAGFTAAESGMTLAFGAQFKEGSETAGFFRAKGNAGTYLARVPNQPFLFALALDSTSPGLKQLFKNATTKVAEADPAGAEAMGLTGAMIKSMEGLDGISFMMGMSPALMGGGLFSNTCAYMSTKDPAGFAEVLKSAMTSMNGKTVQGFTYQTSYTAKSKTVAGAPVDEWSMRMQADPNDPNAQQAMMAMGMIFGMEGGPSGYLAPANGGVVITYSKNTQLLEQALSAARGDGLATSDQIKAVAAALPPDRTIEGYIGVKSIIDMFMGFAAMMGGGAPEVEIPEDLAPIGIGGTTVDGGIRLQVFAPTQVLTTIKALGDMAGNAGAAPEDGAGQPRF